MPRDRYAKISRKTFVIDIEIKFLFAWRENKEINLNKT